MSQQITRAEVEAKTHTRAQLRKWGIFEYPPKKGWKKRLLLGMGEDICAEEEAHYRSFARVDAPGQCQTT